MKYVELPYLTQSEILDRVFDRNLPIEKRTEAMLTAVRHCEPMWAVSLLYDVMREGDPRVAAAGFSLIDMTILLGKISPDLKPFYNWAIEYLRDNPSEKEFIDSRFNSIPNSKWKQFSCN